MKAVVIGAGMMGSALAYDLAQASDIEVVMLADINFERASNAAKNINSKVKPVKIDANSYEDIVELMTGTDAVISAASYSLNYILTTAAIEAGVHFLDLGGNNDVVKKQLLLNRRAREAQICVLPNCGLAPGLVNILAIEGAKKFDAVDEIKLRVGGLPQHPQPPLNYQLVFSAEGLLNEYTEPAEVIRNGNTISVNSLDDVEEIIFPQPFGVLEAFNTSGGISTLCDYFRGKVRELDYKTIRYKGHCSKFKLLIDLGFAGSEALIFGNTVKTVREFFIELLTKKLDYKDEDCILLRATIKGHINGEKKSLVYEMIDYFDKPTGISAMMRTTSFPTSIIALMLMRGEINARGVMPPEECVPADRLLEELKMRNINITQSFVEGEL